MGRRKYTAKQATKKAIDVLEYAVREANPADEERGVAVAQVWATLAVNANLESVLAILEEERATREARKKHSKAAAQQQLDHMRVPPGGGMGSL